MHQAVYKRKGLSLIEVLIYVSVLVVAMAVIVSALITLGDAYGELRALQSMQRSSITALERITREVRLADSIDTGLSVFDTHPGVLVLQHEGESGSETATFSLQDGILQVSENGVSAGVLTDPDVTVSNLVFRLVENDTTEGIRTEMTLQRMVGSITVERTFYTFTVTRK